MPSPITLDDIDNRLSAIEANLDLTQVELSIDNLGEKLDSLNRELKTLYPVRKTIRQILFTGFFLGYPLLLAQIFHSIHL
jgi:hypothetical protein